MLLLRGYETNDQTDVPDVGKLLLHLTAQIKASKQKATFMTEDSPNEHGTQKGTLERLITSVLACVQGSIKK